MVRHTINTLLSIQSLCRFIPIILIELFVLDLNKFDNFGIVFDEKKKYSLVFTLFFIKIERNTFKESSPLLVPRLIQIKLINSC